MGALPLSQRGQAAPSTHPHLNLGFSDPSRCARQKVRPDPVFGPTANLPLPATVRLEALKLLSEACVIIDDEDLSPSALLAYYIQYVVPDLPRTPTDMVDD